jgi:N-acetylneuraminic acid mutarotase
LESVNSVYVYDPQADAWTQLAGMNIARRLHASAAVGGKLHVFGGYGAGSVRLCTAEVYDPASDSWAQVSSLTAARDGMVAIAL